MPTSNATVDFDWIEFERQWRRHEALHPTVDNPGFWTGPIRGQAQRDAVVTAALEAVAPPTPRYDKAVYVSGPMRDEPFFNEPAFKAAEGAALLRRWRAVTPCQFNREQWDVDNWPGYADGDESQCPGFDRQAAMRWNLEQILKVDAVVLLPGWSKSEGTQIELAVARSIGLDVYLYSEAQGYLVGPVDTEGLDIVLDSAPAQSAGQRGHELVNGDRESQYGPPARNFKVIADLWGAYLGVELDPADAVNLMILLKVARLRTGGPHRDSIVDIAGYASVHERLDEK